jgi:hypothetical protein
MAQIIAAVKYNDAPMLMHVRQQLEYCIDVCLVAHGSHIEHLWFSENFFLVFLWL